MPPVPEHGTPEQLADYIYEYTQVCPRYRTVLVSPGDCLSCVADWSKTLEEAEKCYVLTFCHRAVMQKLYDECCLSTRKLYDEAQAQA